MKKYNRIILVILAFSFSFIGIANNQIPELGENENSLQIEIKSESSLITVQRGFETSEELYAFDVSEWLASIDIKDEFCTVSITVKVRVGVDSNFVEVSATVSDIPCADVAAVARRTIQQLKAGIK
ncbi:MAG: hypothetical protein HKN89_06245 [Eudoraea sp.]|nr:hypothetical protein [Eudoraea sp.]